MATVNGYNIIITTRKIQRRKHKKKRINKKWLKRYGYVTYDIQKFGETILDKQNMNIYMSQKTYDDLLATYNVLNKMCKG